MADGFAETLHLDVRRSTWHCCFVVGVHGLAFIVIASLALHWPGFWLALPMIAAAAALAWRRAVLTAANSIVRLRCQPSGDWRWQTRNGQWYRGHLADSFVLSNILVIVSLRDGETSWRVWRCPLFQDSVPTDAHRRLRARLTVMPRASASQ